MKTNTIPVTLEKGEIQLVGIDLETGGLDGYQVIDGQRVHGALYYPLVEVGVVIPTMLNGKIDYSAPCRHISVGIRQTDEMLSRFDPWALKQHTKSGLLARIESGDGFDYVAEDNNDAQAYIIATLTEMGIVAYHRKNGSGAVLVGSNAGFDYNFLDAQMPDLRAMLYYRKIDISTVNMLSRCDWKHVGFSEPVKELNHTAISDINESLAELQSYTEHLDSLT